MDVLNKIIQEGENTIIEINKPDFDIMANTYKILTNKKSPQHKKDLLKQFPIIFYIDNPKESAISFADLIYKKIGSKYVRVGTNLSKEKTYFIDVEFIRVAEFVYIPKEYKIIEPNYNLAQAFLELAKPLGDPEYWKNKINYIQNNKIILRKNKNCIKIKSDLIDKYLSAGFILGGEAGLDVIIKKKHSTHGNKLIFYTDTLPKKGKKFEEIPNLLPPRVEIDEKDVKIIIFQNNDCFSYLENYGKIASPYLIFYYYIIADMIDFDTPCNYTYSDFIKFDFEYLTKNCIGTVSEILKKNLEKKKNVDYYVNYYPGK